MKKAVGLVLLLCFLAALTACGGGSAGGGVSAFKKQVKNGQYNDAIETYSSSIDGDSKKEVEAANYLKEYLSTSWEGYLSGSVSDSEFDAILQTVSKIDQKINKLGWDLKEIQASYPEIAASRKAYQAGVEQMESGDYEAAISSFSEVDDADDKIYEQAREQYQQTVELYLSQIDDEVRLNVSAGDYDAALTILSTAYRTIGYHAKLEELKRHVYTTKFENNMNLYASENNYPAISYLYREALSDGYTEISAGMTKLFSEQEQLYRQTIIEKSISAYKSNGYEAAIPVISEGLSVLPDDSQLLKYDNLYKLCVPVSLDSVITLKGSLSASQNSVTDLYGNTYYGYIVFSLNDSKAGRHSEVELFLDGQYTRLTATCIPQTDSDTTLQLIIYADDVEVFNSRMMEQTTKPIMIDVNVTNVRNLRIEAAGANISGLEWPKIYLANSTLTRELTDEELRG